MAATRGHVCLCSGHEIGLPAKLLRWFPRPGHISRIGAVIRRAYHHAQPLAGELCVPCLAIRANMAPDVMGYSHRPSPAR